MIFLYLLLSLCLTLYGSEGEVLKYTDLVSKHWNAFNNAIDTLAKTTKQTDTLQNFPNNSQRVYIQEILQESDFVKKLVFSVPDLESDPRANLIQNAFDHIVLPFNDIINSQNKTSLNTVITTVLIRRHLFWELFSVPSNRQNNTPPSIDQTELIINDQLVETTHNDICNTVDAIHALLTLQEDLLAEVKSFDYASLPQKMANSVFNIFCRNPFTEYESEEDDNSGLEKAAEVPKELKGAVEGVESSLLLLKKNIAYVNHFLYTELPIGPLNAISNWCKNIEQIIINCKKNDYIMTGTQRQELTANANKIDNLLIALSKENIKNHQTTAPIKTLNVSDTNNMNYLELIAKIRCSSDCMSFIQNCKHFLQRTINNTILNPIKDAASNKLINILKRYCLDLTLNIPADNESDTQNNPSFSVFSLITDPQNTIKKSSNIAIKFVKKTPRNVLLELVGMLEDNNAHNKIILKIRKEALLCFLQQTYQKYLLHTRKVPLIANLPNSAINTYVTLYQPKQLKQSNKEGNNLITYASIKYEEEKPNQLLLMPSTQKEPIINNFKNENPKDPIAQENSLVKTDQINKSIFNVVEKWCSWVQGNKDLAKEYINSITDYLNASDEKQRLFLTEVKTFKKSQLFTSVPQDSPFYTLFQEQNDSAFNTLLFCTLLPTLETYFNNRNNYHINPKVLWQDKDFLSTWETEIDTFRQNYSKKTNELWDSLHDLAKLKIFIQKLSENDCIKPFYTIIKMIGNLMKGILKELLKIDKNTKIKIINDCYRKTTETYNNCRQELHQLHNAIETLKKTLQDAYCHTT
ncbi:hypothetical protein EKK58_01535 [Candidatus Dependentiae bacterium]|nr:MAG: hypothetical protein EKK58_01535 [Candidatus Dependentiae bacterium]